MIAILGHRGSGAPENTLIAFEKAMEEGAEGIEFDVQATRDGRAVIAHGDRDNHVLTPQGEKRIRELSYEEVVALDAGLATSQSEVNGGVIPTLEEVFDWAVARYQKTGHMPFMNIELKAEATSQIVSDMVKRYVADTALTYDVILVSSFYHHELDHYERLEPECEVGALFAPDSPLSYRGAYSTKEIEDRMRMLGYAEVMHIPIDDATDELIEFIRHHKKKILTYPTREPVPEKGSEMVENIRRWDIEYVVTDSPGKMKEALSA